MRRWVVLSRGWVKSLSFIAGVLLLNCIFDSVDSPALQAQNSGETTPALKLHRVPVRINYDHDSVKGEYYTEMTLPLGFETEYKDLPISFLAAGRLGGTCLSTYPLSPVEPGLKLSYACYDFESPNTDNQGRTRWEFYSNPDFAEFSSRNFIANIDACETISYREFWQGNVLDRENVSRSNLWTFPREALMEELARRGATR